MGCCGGPSRVAAVPTLRAAFIQEETPVARNAVRMEFTGTQLGALFFTVDNVQYRGSASATDKYIDADPAHVKTLEQTGLWKQVAPANADTKASADSADTKASAKK